MKLTNDRHEKFCHAMLEFGGNWKKVMDACEYKHSNSFYSQLKHMPKIQARLEELTKDAVSEKVLVLSARLEMLSEIARDVSLNKNTRISALRELHAQSGDAITKLDVTSSTESVIKYVDIKLPKKINAKPTPINDDALEGLDEFLNEIVMKKDITPIPSPIKNDIDELF